MGHIDNIILQRLGIDTGLEVLIELCVVTRMRTSEVGCCCPDLAVGHELFILFVHDTHTEETVTALAEEGRLCILDHTLLGKDILPSLVAREIIEVGSRLLTEVATTHLHAADVL